MRTHVRAHPRLSPFAAAILCRAAARLGWCLAGVAALSASADRMVVMIDSVPESGLVVARLDLAQAAQWCQVVPEAGRLRAFDVLGDRELPAQWVSDEAAPARGVLVLRCPPGRPARAVRLDFSG